MRSLHLVALVTSFGAICSSALTAQAPVADRYRQTTDRIIDEAQKDSAAWNRLAELTDRFGHRLSGSASLERAIDWMLAEMKKDGLNNVRGERVTH